MLPQDVSPRRVRGFMSLGRVTTFLCAFPVTVFKLEIESRDVAEPVHCTDLVRGGDLGRMPRAGHVHRLLVVDILQEVLITQDNNNNTDKLHFFLHRILSSSTGQFHALL